MRLFIAFWGGILLSCEAQAALRLEVLGGTSFSLPTTLSIYQENQPKIEFTANYETRPLTDAPYYSVRLGWWDAGGGWELENIHHKIYLTNTTAEVEDFRVTFGYNLLLLNRAWALPWITIRLGVGTVLAHASNRVRGQSFSHPDAGIFSGRYGLVGIGSQLSLSHQWHLLPHVFLNFEVKFTAAYALVPIANGVAHTPNLAVHTLVGIGTEF